MHNIEPPIEIALRSVEAFANAPEALRSVIEDASKTLPIELSSDCLTN